MFTNFNYSLDFFSGVSALAFLLMISLTLSSEITRGTEIWGWTEEEYQAAEG